MNHKKVSKKKLGAKPIPSLPWQVASSTEVDDVLSTLVEELAEADQEQQNPENLTRAQRNTLQRDFQNAGQGRGPALRAMTQLAKSMKIDDPDNAAYLGPMKRWSRAAEKFNANGRKLNDLGRGRLLVRTPQDIEEFYKVLSSKDKDGGLDAFGSKKVTIIHGSMDDYLSAPRKSGYAGSINFDIETNCTKGQNGRLEVQIMPESYEEVYDFSHKLFAMIRSLQEIPDKWRSEDQNYVLDALVIANTALFDEESLRTGFYSLRTHDVIDVDQETLKQVTDVLDRLGVKLDSLKFSQARNVKPAWLIDTREALSISKTSMLNLFLRSSRSKPAHDNDSALER